MRVRFRGHLATLAAILIAFSSEAVDAQSRGEEGVALHPPFAAEWVLTVSGAGGALVTRVFRSGEPIVIPLNDLTAPTIDGEYAYELKSNRDATYAGRFTIARGRIASHAGSPAFDVVIPDDLIVQGSECVGLDCVDGEGFGYDTIRLKENNTRIHFDDTSTSAGYPANDWEIQANSRDPGGGNYLAIIDRVTNRLTFRIDASAPTDAVRVASSGRLGLRTGSPVLDIHALTTDTPAIRLDQSNAGGYTAQTWDIGANEANFFVRDVTGGSKLSFRIRPGAPTSSLDISASGNVGIGTPSPSQKLHVLGAARVEGLLNLKKIAAPAAPASSQDVNVFFDTNSGHVRWQFSDSTQPFGVVPGTFTGAGGVNIDGVIRMPWGSGVPTPGAGTVYIWHDSSDTNLRFRFPGGTTALLTSAGVWTDASSRTFKTNIRPLEMHDALVALRGLAPTRYFYNGVDDEHVGFIAEDVPDLVATKGREGLAPMDIVAVLTKVVQDQQTRIDAMAAELAALRAAIGKTRKSAK